MSSAEPLVGYEPAELNFSLELNKQLSSSIRLWNRTDSHVVYKLLTTNPRKYGVRSKVGVLPPRSYCDIRVTTRPVKEAPCCMRSKDRFMIRSAIASPGTTAEDAQNMFKNGAGDAFPVSKLRVAYSWPDSSSVSSEVNNVPNLPQVTTPDIEPADNGAEVTIPDMGPDDNVAQNSPMKLLEFQPPELKIHSVNQEKDSSCLLQLSNSTTDHVAFRVGFYCLRKRIQSKNGVSSHVTCVYPFIDLV
ncbi:vesicle-associated protein 1-1-like isoform X3 [Andrographis paniculata]|uniref:vesicle-associated protein 1-1-like isoform X3 n=1 Tax=Andrographis paniculata TaxID=175694 RepID=UPI0021E74EFE|nr:vesicle-associated protein 1-1-like isoform X3 [Andrographis paniculata]